MTCLSDHFTLAELTVSQTAARRGINNKPTGKTLENLKRVAAVLEQVRDHCGGAVQVSSGYRSPALNRAIGGSTTSAHCKGLAADFTVQGQTPKQTCAALIDSGIVWDQLIYEGTWVHIGLSEGAPRRQVLTAHFGRGKTTYTTGLSKT